MKNFLMILVVLLGYCASAFASDTPAQSLSDKFRAIQTMQADFKQTIYNTKNQKVAESQGSMVIVRPDKFYWRVVKPTKQLIVADGHTFWIYNQSLQQVMVKKQDKNVAATPALLLSANATDLTRLFHVSIQHGWYVLQAHDEKNIFQLITLKFSGNAISQMEMTDNFGQKGKLQFSSIKINAPVDEKLFKFSVPNGVDIIRQ